MKDGFARFGCGEAASPQELADLHLSLIEARAVFTSP
jgi:hypothetical protein